MKLYVSGPITGMPDKNKDAFEIASNWLKTKNIEPLNPFDFEQDGFTWTEYLKRDIRLLLDCDGLFLLKGWDCSRGARLEVNIAVSLDMPCYFQLNGELEIMPIIVEPVITPLIASSIWQHS